MSLLPAPVATPVADPFHSTDQAQGGEEEIHLLPATRLGAILFAKLMASVGSVETIGVRDSSLDGTRLVTHVPDADGYTVAFLSVIDGNPDVTDFNFDFGDSAQRHLLHSDGRGLTLCDYRNLPHVHYRLPATIPTAVAAAAAYAATNIAIPAPRKGN